MSERDPNEIGALWEKTGRNGTYFTGKVGDQPVVIFKNGNKREGSNAPDWRVLKPQKQEPRAAVATEPVAHITDDDIAF